MGGCFRVGLADNPEDVFGCSVPTFLLDRRSGANLAPLGVVTVIRMAALIGRMLGKLGLRERDGLFAENHSQ